jgi:hypothetical protein
MTITDEDRATIVAWAERHPQIGEVWLYGSRARCEHHADSDIDLAIVMGFADWAFWHDDFIACPDLTLPYPVHLEWYQAGVEMNYVGPGVQRDGMRLYVRA